MALLAAAATVADSFCGSSFLATERRICDRQGQSTSHGRTHVHRLNANVASAAEFGGYLQSKAERSSIRKRRRSREVSEVRAELFPVACR